MWRIGDKVSFVFDGETVVGIIDDLWPWTCSIMGDDAWYMGIEYGKLTRVA